MAKQNEKKLVPCLLYDAKEFKYPKGRMVTELSERESLLKDGFNTGPVDKAKTARRNTEKAEIKKTLREEAKAELAAEKAEKEAKKAAKASAQ